MTASDERKPFSLAIVGGGIGGLCLAVALHSHHVPIHVYEAAPAFTEIGAGVGLGPNALRAMALLSAGILRGYKRCETSHASPEERKRFFNFRYGMEKPSAEGMVAGDLICDLRSESETSSVHRARFLNELVNLLPPGAASAGKRLTDLHEEGDGVALKFADGTEARHNAAVGCDGIKSQVRKVLLGGDDKASDAVFSGKFCYRGLVPAEKAIAILGEDLALNSQMYLGHHGHVLTTVIEHGKTVNVVGYHTKADGKWDEGAPWVQPSAKEDMLASFNGWSEAVRKVIDLVEKPDVWALFDHLPAATYHRHGKICLLGDSAHASTPHHGAGAGMAVEDAMILSHLLGAIDRIDDLDAAFAAYDAVRRPRSQRLVASSRKIARVYDFEDEVIGHDIGALREYLEHAWDWIWKEDLDLQLAKALDLLRENQRKKGRGEAEAEVEAEVEMRSAL